MNVTKDVFENKWEQIRAQSKAWWSLFSDDDLNKVANAPIKRKKYAMLLRVKYGYTPERVKEEINKRITDLGANPPNSELLRGAPDQRASSKVSKVRKSRGGTRSLPRRAPLGVPLMQPFTVHRGRVAPLLRRDIDTDQIIPKQFLKSIERAGFGKFLFYDWRFAASGQPDAGFVLNDPRYAGASVLVAGANFGCGSSREHAAWALEDYGFRAIVAPSFADIFRNNAVTNGLLPVVVSEPIAAAIADKAATIDGYSLEIDLEARRVRDSAGIDEAFTIDNTSRHRLLNGLDDIGLILEHEPAIARYEARLTSPASR